METQVSTSWTIFPARFKHLQLNTILRLVGRHWHWLNIGADARRHRDRQELCDMMQGKCLLLCYAESTCSRACSTFPTAGARHSQIKTSASVKVVGARSWNPSRGALSSQSTSQVHSPRQSPRRRTGDWGALADRRFWIRRLDAEAESQRLDPAVVLSEVEWLDDCDSLSLPLSLSPLWPLKWIHTTSLLGIGRECSQFRPRALTTTGQASSDRPPPLHSLRAIESGRRSETRELISCLLWGCCCYCCCCVDCVHWLQSRASECLILRSESLEDRALNKAVFVCNHCRPSLLHWPHLITKKCRFTVECLEGQHCSPKWSGHKVIIFADRR